MVVCYNPSTIGDLHVGSISTLSVAGSNSLCNVSYMCWELNYDLYHCLMLGLDCVCVCLCGSTVSCAAVFKTILFGVHVDPQHISHHMTRASSTCGHEDMQS